MASSLCGGMDLQVFEHGQQVEHKGWFEDPDQSPDGHFSKWRVYIPPCFVTRRGEALSVAAMPDVAPRLLRAAVVDIGDDPY